VTGAAPGTEGSRRLEKAVDDARRAGDEATEATALADLAVAYLAGHHTGKARAALRRSLGLHRAAGRDGEAAKAVYAIALLDARDPAGDQRATAGFTAALGTFEAAGDDRMVGRTRAHLATLAWRAGRYAEASDHLEAAEGAFRRSGDDGRTVEARRLRAFMMLLGGDADAAYRCLLEGAAAADETGGPHALELRFDLRRLCSAGLVDPDLSPPSLEEILRDADAAGKRRLAGHVVLSQAAEHLGAGRTDEAAACAEDARRRALGGPDPVLYLLACLLLARIAEQRADDLGVVTILLTCQASLGDLLGEAARRPVLDVIASVERRWGNERFGRALAAHRATFDPAPSP
jgi:hypothetical protein